MTPVTPLRVAFRTDAAIKIGTGHVMRCLTLAAALKERGAECVFLCRPHEGHLLDAIAAQGHDVRALPPLEADSEAAEADGPPHAAWVGTSWAEDARDSRSALEEFTGGETVDWLVVDHYGLDARWERSLRAAYNRLMVIDDLADRPHECDLLLDQSLGRVVEDYTGLIPPKATTLLGPAFALLRPEFSRMREGSLARRQSPHLGQVLVTMGGVDKDNATTLVLEALDAAPLPQDVKITVVMGATAPWLDAVRSRAARMRHPTDVLVDVRDMARVMAESDLAIGAGGTTTWERCALGLPTITVVLAENQKGVAQALQAAGATIILHLDRDDGEGLYDILSRRDFLQLLCDMSQAAKQVTDGDGARHVVRNMINADA